jgi:hypothetical protein
MHKKTLQLSVSSLATAAATTDPNNMNYCAASASENNNKNNAHLRQTDNDCNRISLVSSSLLRQWGSTPGTTTATGRDSLLGEFEPMEFEDLSETDRDEPQHGIQEQRQQKKLPIISPQRSGKKEEERTTTTTTTAANASSTPPLLSVQELIDLLHEVNQDATVYRNKRRNRRVPAVVDANNNQIAASIRTPRPHLMKLDDLTSVLKHINIAEEAKRPIRWDLIGEMTAVVYGEMQRHLKPKMDGMYEETVAHSPKDGISDYDMDENVQAGDASSAGCRTTSVEETSREILKMMLERTDSQSMCSSDCDTQDEDGYPLNPSAYTCASSVTWWEGSMYEEVEVNTYGEDLWEEVEVMTDDEDNFYNKDENESTCVVLEFEGECASVISSAA